MSPTHLKKSEKHEKRPDELEQAWEDLEDSGQEITMAKIARLGNQFGYTTGKWVLYAESNYKIDNLWAYVARAVVQGQCGIRAKVSSTNDVDPGDGHNVIKIYNNFTNYNAVMDLEKQIRKAGIKCPMKYKPCVYTALRIYNNNPWKLRPTIYHSDFDVKTMQSRIMRVTDTQKLELVYDSSSMDQMDSSNECHDKK